MNTVDKLIILAKHPLYALLFFLLLFIIFLILYFSLSSGNLQQTAEPTVTAPTSVQLPTTAVETNKPYTSDKPLTAQERQYVQATPQVFPDRSTAETGTLVIESKPKNIKVVLDVVTDTETLEYKIPYNTAPFKYDSMPVGRYTVSSAADGYEYTIVYFTIEKGKVTRVNLELAPLPE